MRSRIKVIKSPALILALLILLSTLAPILSTPFKPLAQVSVVKAQQGKSIPITIVERSGNDLTNYTVKVELTADNFDDWDSILYDNGTDVYFTDSQGTPLYYWIEEFDRLTKYAVIWVRVPYIPSNGKTIIYMHFGGDNPYADYRNMTKVFVRVIDGLIGAWRFEEGVGTTTSDWSGRGNNGTLLDNNATNTDGDLPPQWVDGKFGKALYFDGVDDYVNIPNSNAEVFNASNPFTICAWIYPISDPLTEGHHYTILGEWQILFGYKIHNDTDTWLVLHGGWSDLGWGGASYFPSPILPPENWYFVCGKYDGDSLYLYLNGELKDRVDNVGTNTRSTFDIHIGCWGYAPTFDGVHGVIDEVYIFNRNLTCEEIFDLYSNAPYITLNCPGKVLVRKYVQPEPTVIVGVGIGILLRCFDKLLNKLNYEPLKILLVNKTTGEIIKELTGGYEFFFDTQLPQGTYLIIIKFMDVVLKALEVYFNATVMVEVNSTVPALSLLADYRGLSRSFICNKTIVDVEDLNPKFPYSRSRILINGTGHFKLFINYQGDLPSGVSVSSNVTNLQYYWNGTYLVIEGDLGSVGEVVVADLYKVSFKVYDRLGNPIPVQAYVYINGTKHTGATKPLIEAMLFPEDWEVTFPVRINGFKFYGYFDGHNETVRYITVTDSDQEYNVWYLVATNASVRVSEVQSLSSWVKRLFARLFQYEEGEFIKHTIEGYLLDYYGDPVPNRKALINVTNLETGYSETLEATTDVSGYFTTTIDLMRGYPYNITVYFAGDDIYADTSTSLQYTVPTAPAPAVAGVPVEYYVIAIAVAIIAVVAIIIAVRGARSIIPYRPRKYVGFKS